MHQELGSLLGSDLSLCQKLVRLPLRLIPRSSVMRVRAGVNKGMLWEVGSNTHQCWLGTYEAPKQKAIIRDVKPNMIVWDVGANVGFYTLAFSRIAGEQGRVLAFEPLGINVAYLLKHIELNRLGNVKVVQCAVSDKNSMVPFSIGSHSSMGRIEMDSSYLVPSISLDQFLAQTGEPPPSLIKIDVEGAEAMVLRGALNLLQSKRPELWLALHGDKAKADCTEILRAIGYQFFTIDGVTQSSIEHDEVVVKYI